MAAGQSQGEVTMSESDERRLIIAMLAEGNPVWYIAAMVNKRGHDVYLIGRSAGYPDRTKLRRSVWAQQQQARRAA